MDKNAVLIVLKYCIYRLLPSIGISFDKIAVCHCRVALYLTEAGVILELYHVYSFPGTRAGTTSYTDVLL